MSTAGIRGETPVGETAVESSIASSAISPLILLLLHARESSPPPPSSQRSPRTPPASTRSPAVGLPSQPFFAPFSSPRHPQLPRTTHERSPPKHLCPLHQTQP